MCDEACYNQRTSSNRDFEKIPRGPHKKTRSGTLRKNSALRSQTDAPHSSHTLNGVKVCSALFGFIHPRAVGKISAKRRKMATTRFLGFVTPELKGGGKVTNDLASVQFALEKWPRAQKRRQKFLQLLNFLRPSDKLIADWLWRGLRRMDSARVSRGRNPIKSGAQPFEQPAALAARRLLPSCERAGILLMSFRHDQEFVAHPKDTLQSGARKLIIGCTV